LREIVIFREWIPGGVHDQTAGAATAFLYQEEGRSCAPVAWGEKLDALSGELGVTAARLSKWGEMFLSAGMPSLKSRPRDGRDEEIVRLKEVIGELSGRPIGGYPLASLWS
jgi:hypothetical protein